MIKSASILNLLRKNTCILCDKAIIYRRHKKVINEDTKQ